MEDYPYDASLEWVPREYPVDDYPAPPRPVPQWQQPQYYQQSGSLQAQQPWQQVQQRQPGLAAASTAGTSTKGRMSKSEALDLLESLKKSILVAALIAFGVISGLVATHVVGSAANNTSSPSPSRILLFPSRIHLTTVASSTSKAEAGVGTSSGRAARSHLAARILPDEVDPHRDKACRLPRIRMAYKNNYRLLSSLVVGRPAPSQACQQFFPTRNRSR